MKKVKIREALGVGWTQFVRRPWYLFGLALATILLFAATAAQSAVVTALSYIVYGGYLSLMLRHYAGEHIQFDDLFDYMDQRWISFAFLGLIKTFFIVLGFLCFIVPGVYLSIRWMFSDLLVIDKGMRPLEALRASSKLTEGHRWKLFGFSVTAAILIGLSLLVFIIGAIVTSIVVGFAVIKLYKDLQETEVVTEEPQEV